MQYMILWSVFILIVLFSNTILFQSKGSNLVNWSELINTELEVTLLLQIKQLQSGSGGLWKLWFSNLAVQFHNR